MVDIANYMFIDGEYLRRQFDRVRTEYFGHPGELGLRRVKEDCSASKAILSLSDSVHHRRLLENEVRSGFTSAQVAKFVRVNATCHKIF
jgi:hypothetical protein